MPEGDERGLGFPAEIHFDIHHFAEFAEMLQQLGQVAEFTRNLQKIIDKDTQFTGCDIFKDDIMPFQPQSHPQPKRDMLAT